MVVGVLHATGPTDLPAPKVDLTRVMVFARIQCRRAACTPWAVTAGCSAQGGIFSKLTWNWSRYCDWNVCRCPVKWIVLETASMNTGHTFLCARQETPLALWLLTLCIIITNLAHLHVAVTIGLFRTELSHGAAPRLVRHACHALDHYVALKVTNTLVYTACMSKVVAIRASVPS